MRHNDINVVRERIALTIAFALVVGFVAFVCFVG